MLLRNLPAFLIVAAAFAAPMSASADTIGPWSLNATLCGGQPMPSCFGGPWGSVSISDSADAERVDVAVSLVNPARVSDVYLNFDDQFFSSGDLTFTMLAYIGSVFETVNASFNGEKVGGYKTLVDNGTYDLHIPFNSTVPVSLLTFTLCSGIDPPGNPNTNPSFCNDSVDLNVAHFDFSDAFGLTHVAVFRNAAGGGQDPVPNILMDAAPVPEPGSLLLLGSGLAVAARRFRRRRS